MSYTSFTIQKHPKEKDRWKIHFTDEKHNSMGKWIGGGTFGDLFLVSRVFYVLMNFSGMKPIGVFDSIEKCAEVFKKTHGCEVIIKSD